MVIRREARAGAAGVPALIAVVSLLSGCAQEQAADPGHQESGPTAEQATEGSPGTTTVTAPASSAAGKDLTVVDSAGFAAPGSPGTYAWNYSTGGAGTGLCVSHGDGVTCTGRPGPSVPDLSEHFPGRPGAVELGAAGVRYTFVEGVPPASARLGTRQVMEIGQLRCVKPDAATLECSYGPNSFTVSGPGSAISTSGTVLAERDMANHSRTGSPADSSSGSVPGVSAGQPGDHIGATGLVSGVRTSSGRLVTASAPPCDGRGILILDSFVETAQPQQGIAALLDRHPGAEFTTPGQCPSLRGELDGARVYPIYTDHGNDTAALCRDKESRGGNARILSTSTDYSEPC